MFLAHLLFLVALIIGPFKETAWAYIDPGAGSLLLQVLLAGFLTVLLYLKKIKLWFVSLFRKSKANNPDSNNTESE